MIDKDAAHLPVTVELDKFDDLDLESFFISLLDHYCLIITVNEVYPIPSKVGHQNLVLTGAGDLLFAFHSYRHTIVANCESLHQQSNLSIVKINRIFDFSILTKDMFDLQFVFCQSTSLVAEDVVHAANLLHKLDRIDVA